MQMLLSTLGAPPQHFLDKCDRAKEFDFSSWKDKPPKMSLKERLRNAPPNMVRMVESMVRWSP